MGRENSCPKGVTQLLSRAPLECRLLSIQAQVVQFYRLFVGNWSRGIHSPKTYGCSAELSKKPGLSCVRPHGKSVHSPGVDFGFNRTRKAQADIRALAHIDQPSRPVLQFLSADSEVDGVPACGRANLEECGLKIKLLFIDGTRAA